MNSNMLFLDGGCLGSRHADGYVAHRLRRAARLARQPDRANAPGTRAICTAWSTLVALPDVLMADRTSPGRPYP